MKKNMMIIGCQIIRTNEDNPDDSVFKLTCIPLTVVKPKTSLMSLASGGFEALMKNAQQMQQLEDIIYINLGEWKNNKYKIGSHITIEILSED